MIKYVGYFNSREKLDQTKIHYGTHGVSNRGELNN